MLNQLLIQNNWPKIKNQILSKWNKLTELDVEETHGRSKYLEKLILEKYGKNMNFNQEYEKICDTYAPHLSKNKRSEMDMVTKSMDKDRDNQYLAGPNGVTRPIHNKIKLETEIEDENLDGYNNVDRHSADYSGLNDQLETKENTLYNTASDEFPQYQDPDPYDQDITSRRSNSSANTTSHSAHSSSEAMSKDTKKL
jgi:hypothetical protein